MTDVRRRLSRVAAASAAAMLGLFPIAVSAVDLVVEIDPADVAAAALPDAQFEVRLVANNITDPITGYDIRLDYDRSKIEVVSVDYDSWVNLGDVVPATSAVPPGALPTAFRHLAAVDLDGTDVAAEAAATSRVLATITFQTTGSPTGAYSIEFNPNNRALRPANPLAVVQDNMTLAVADSGATSVDDSALASLGVLGADTDGDGVMDILESADASPADATITNFLLHDSDSDGISDIEELNWDKASQSVLYDFVRNSNEPNPRFWDTDGDGYSDGLEVRYPAIFVNGPLVADSPADTDGDGLPNALDPNPSVPSADHDGDLIRDEYELSVGVELAMLSSVTPPLGDTTGNGTFQPNDVTFAFQFFRGILAVLPPGIGTIDVVANGRLQSNDATAIAQRSRGVLTQPLPIRP